MSVSEHPDRIHDDEDTVTIEVPCDDLADFRLMLREQIAGDSEQLRWIREHDGGRRREDHLAPERLQRRIRLCWLLADAVGGLYGDPPTRARTARRR